MTYSNVDGRSRATAEALLAAAARVGVPSNVVRTTIRGYVVPDAVADEYRRMLSGQTPSVEESAVEVPEEGPLIVEAPDRTWTNDEIKTWAEAHGVDLGSATKKADMLAAIQAADTEEG